MAFGIAAPLPYEVIGHGLLFVDIAIANTFFTLSGLRDDVSSGNPVVYRNLCI